MNSSLVQLAQIYPTANPPFVKVYNWEIIDLYSWRVWIHNNWFISIYASILYVILIFLGRRWMESKKGLDMRKLLFAWNAALAIFSIFATCRLIPEALFRLTRPWGFHATLCSREGIHSHTGAFWGLMFVFSKIVELGDTAFIVLRKRKLIFLHWYHHISVLLFVWTFYAAYEPPSSWFVLVNYIVHSAMYTYYALMSANIKVSRRLAACVTLMQIGQMAVAVSVTLYTLIVKLIGGDCVSTSYKFINSAILMYLSYLFLFSNFYWNTYVKNLKSKLA